VGSVTINGTMKNDSHRKLKLKHTEVVLDLDLEHRHVVGVVKMRFDCPTDRVSKIQLHARQIEIRKVYIQEKPARYKYQSNNEVPCDPALPIRDVSHSSSTQSPNSNLTSFK
jgi:aminopeptidase N